MKWFKYIMTFLTLLALAVCVDFAVAAAVMWIWNMIVPFVFVGVTALTYWQAFGLCVLVSLFRINYKSSDNS